MKQLKKSSIRKVFSGTYTQPSREESFLFETVPSFFSSLWLRQSKKNLYVSEWVERYQQQCIYKKNGMLWAGHATCLITIGGITIVTDPMFNSLPFFSRYNDFAIPIDLFPSVDIVLLSHNHFDHMDMPSLYTIQHRSPDVYIAVAQGDKKWFNQKIFSSVEEYQWSEQFVFEKNNKQVTCTFVPAYHWSRRSLFDRNKSLWGSWVIEYNNKVIYFGGDTAYNTHFKEIGDLYDIDIALLPIAPAEPHEHMKHSHMSPEQAGQAFIDLRAKQFIPIHWGTFAFGFDGFDEPIVRLKNWWKKNTPQLADKKLHCFKMGHVFLFN